MENNMRDVIEGSVTFDQFARETETRWRKLARMLLRRWGAMGVDEDDLLQELLIGAWLALPKWEADRASLEKFVVWQAMNAAKLWLHRQRGASSHGSRDRNQSRGEYLTRNGVEDEFTVEIEAAQEAIVHGLERLRLACRLIAGSRTRTALAAVGVTGSIDGALALLSANGQQVKRGTVLRAMRLAAASLED